MDNIPGSHLLWTDVAASEGIGTAMTDLASGTRLAGYRLERLIGAGGMGSVYLATEVALERRVAVKVIRPELAGDDRFRRRFLLECKLIAQLEHPAIVPVYSAGDSEGRLFIAMRYLAGGSLEERLRRDGPLSPAETIAMLAPVADALDAAHAAGMVHRDVKPGNILLEGFGAFLCDFGLARRAESASGVSREDGLLVSGTLGYVAPEQLEGDTVDGRTDQYALACVLFHCLAGRQPFPGDVELAVVYAHLSEPPPRLSGLNPRFRLRSTTRSSAGWRSGARIASPAAPSWWSCGCGAEADLTDEGAPPPGHRVRSGRFAVSGVERVRRTRRGVLLRPRSCRHRVAGTNVAPAGRCGPAGGVGGFGRGQVFAAGGRDTATAADRRARGRAGVGGMAVPGVHPWPGAVGRTGRAGGVTGQGGRRRGATATRSRTGRVRPHRAAGRPHQGWHVDDGR
jgi:tRNA A-37 threonylcarbamoyl transferase component Bud32